MNSAKIDGIIIFLRIVIKARFAKFPYPPSIVSGLRMRGMKIDDGFYISEK